MKTIIAIATPQTNGPLGIIRISGPNAFALLNRNFVASAEFFPRALIHGYFCDRKGMRVDEILAVKFPAPHSFTGEDVVELHGHGNLILLQKILNELLFHEDLNVEMAAPGEFTLRAFHNDKIDLVQAEAIHELIQATSEASLQASLANLSGEFSQLIAQMRSELLQALVLVEASFEFPEEGIETYDRGELSQYIESLLKTLRELLAAFTTSQLSDQGVSVALIGRPNVGKSSLLNAVLREEKAIVTDVPGTTRDVVEGALLHAGFRFVLRDTAGLRSTDDVVESVGVERTKQWLQRSQIVLLITDNPHETFAEFNQFLEDRIHIYRILSKSDLLSEDQRKSISNFDAIVSAKARTNLEMILDIFEKYLKSEKHVQISVHINQRQNSLLSKAKVILENVYLQLQTSNVAEELLAEELRACAQTLQEITGEISSDMVLGEIFSRFCIGK